MSQRKKATIAFLSCAALVLLQPSFLDHLRYPVSRVASWPARTVAGWFRDDKPIESDPAAEARLGWARRTLENHAATVESIAVIDVRAQHLIVAQGYEDGVGRGCLVSSGGALVGEIDRAGPKLSRVRLLSHEALTFGGIVGPESADPYPVLLRGAEHGVATPQKGCLIPSEHVGAAVVSAPEEGRLAGSFLIGHVEHSTFFNAFVVRLAVEAADLDEVVVHRAADGAVIPPSEEPLFDVVVARVLLGSDTFGRGRSVLVSAGAEAGVTTGTFVSRGVDLLGRIGRCGRSSARVVPFASATREFPVLAVNSGSDAVGSGIRRFVVDAKDRERWPEGVLLTSSGVGASLVPRGLRVADRTEGALGMPPALRGGEAVDVHVFRHREELETLRRGTQPR